MKPTINNLNEVLTYILEGMYDAEKQIQKALPEWLVAIHSSTLKTQVRKYGENGQDKRTKLKRIFSYVLAGPYKRKNGIVLELRAEWIRTSRMTQSKRLKDVAFVACIRSLIQYKLAEYNSARDLALQLDVQATVDLLEEIIAWENVALNMFTKIPLTEVNEQANTADVLN